VVAHHAGDFGLYEALLELEDLEFFFRHGEERFLLLDERKQVELK